MIEVDFPTRGPGYLDLARADEALRNATKLYLTDNITLYEDGVPLPPPRIVDARVSLPSDRSFASLRAGPRPRAGPPLADELDLYWNQQLLDVLLEYPIRSDRSEFAIRSARRPARAERLHRAALPAARRRRRAPSSSTAIPASCGSIRAGTRPRCASSRSGFWHILEGTDHLLFLLCLVIPFRRLRPLVIIVTVVHRRAFDLADRLGLRLRAGRAVVSAADRDADRGHHRLHGAGKHRLRGDGNARERRLAALDHRLRVRARARLRLLVRAARIAAIRRRPSRHRRCSPSTSASSSARSRCCWC